MRLQQREDLESSLFVPVNVLKTPQKRRNIVARLGVELDVLNAQLPKPKLCLLDRSHGSDLAKNARYRGYPAESLPHLKNLCNPESPNQAQIQIVAYFMASTR